jgi:phosphohistidine phosphatase SixA
MAIYLVREADAGGRFSWPGPDRLRPLTSSGWRQAQELAERLDGAPIDRIVSSPWLRCQQSVLPLAEALQLPIQSETGLGQIASIDRAMRLIMEAGATTVFCTHPELVYAIIEQLRSAGRLVRPLCGVAWKTERAVSKVVAAG